MKKKRIALYIVCALLLIIGIFFLVKLFVKKVSVKENFFTVKKEVYENEIEISGTVQAAEEQILQALSDGTVLGVFVKEGDEVKKGDVIIQLDDSDQQYNLAKHDFNIATTRIMGSAREIKLMETERLALVQRVADRKVVATFDGVIAELDVAVGDSLEAKDSVGTLVNIDYLIAEVEIAETDVGQLKIGQKVEFSFSAYKDKVVYGSVIGWPAIGEITSRGATIVKAKIKIEEFPPEILPNYSFTGKIKISDPVEYFLVSQYAISKDGNQYYVVLKDSNEKVPVKIEPYGSSVVKISGDKIYEGVELLQLTKPPVSGSKKTVPNQMNGRPMSVRPMR